MTDNDENSPPPQNADDWLASGTSNQEYAAVTAAQAVGNDGSDGTVAGSRAFDALGGADGDGVDGSGLPPGFDGGPFPGGAGGGLAGEQHLTGTLTAVGASTITVKSSSGTATYQIASDTQIVRDRAAAQLSDLQAGDPVLVHVFPASSDSNRMIVERVFAGTRPSLPGVDPDGDGDDGAGGATGQPSTNT